MNNIWPSYINKIDFTSKLNRFRADTANQAHDIFDSTAANMKVINWDEELQYFAVNSLNKFDIDAPIYCGTTERYKSVSIVTSYFASADNVYDNYFENIKQTILQRKRRSERFSMIIDAEMEAVGCAVIQYVVRQPGNDSNVVAMQCLFSHPGGRDFNAIYKSGGRCDLCDCIEKCSQFFRGLCAYRHLEAQKIYCKSVGRNMRLNVMSVNVNNSDSTCVNVTQVDSLYIHFNVIYTLVLIVFVTHFVFYMYYRGFESLSSEYRE